MPRQSTFTLALTAAALGLVASTIPVGAQVLDRAGPALPASAFAVDSLVALAIERSPTVREAVQRVEAARARVGPSGALPDPMLGVGIRNVPIRDPGLGDFMTMTTVGIGQRLPFPGKRPLATRAAELEVEAADAQLQATRVDLAAAVRRAYYDLAFFDGSLDVVERNQTLVLTLVQVTESRYAAASGAQGDVLEARLDAAGLTEEVIVLAEARRAALAELNALLDRPSDTPVEEPYVPEPIARAAVAVSPERIRFTSATVGARVADSPVPPLEDLQARAIANSPVLRAHEAEVAAQAARMDLARKAHLPDFDLSVEYAQRVDNADMMSLMVSVPIPVHRAARQHQEVAEARADLAALEAGHHAMINELNAEVAARHTEIERARSQLALLVTSIVPQGRAALESATVAFHTGTADLMAVLESQAALYDYEVAYLSALSDFAKGLADLERAVGAEVLP
ncbi:MAG: TolC family protein [Longimicrobiales bacterium]